MFDAIKQFFEKLASPEETSEQDKQHAIHLAVAVLLTEMMRIDDQITSEEKQHLSHLLEQKFSLNTEEKQALLEMAEQKLKDSVDYYQFTSVINIHFDQAEKIKVIESMWQIAYIDGKLDAHEEHFIRKIHSLLHISHNDFMKAKHRVKSQSQVNNEN